MSQAQLAERSRLSVRFISLLESEEGYRPRFEMAETLCKYFDVPLGHLFFFDWERVANDRELQAVS